MVGSAINVRTGGAVGSAEGFCGSNIILGNGIGAPASLTVVLSTATGSPVRNICSYPSSSVEVNADCDTELPLDSFRRFCPCVNHNCDGAWFLGYSGESCDATCANVGGVCLVDPLSEISDADSFQNMVASTIVLQTGETIGDFAASFCSDGINLFTFASAPAAISLVHGSSNQTLCTYPTSPNQFHGNCGVSFHAPPAQRFCNCRVDSSSDARRLFINGEENVPQIGAKTDVQHGPRRLRGSPVYNGIS